MVTELTKKIEELLALNLQVEMIAPSGNRRQRTSQRVRSLATELARQMGLVDRIDNKMVEGVCRGKGHV